MEKLLLFACLVFSGTLCQTVSKFQASSFDELSFFPTSWSAVFSQVLRRSIFKFCVYKLAEAVRYLKFKWVFVIIGRDCLVLLKFKSSLCWRILCFKALLRLCSFGIKLPCVNPTSVRADSQWITILKTFELITLSFSEFHAQRNWLLTQALHIFNQYMRLLCCFWSLMWLRKIDNSFFTVCFVRLLFSASNLIFDLGLNV